MMNIFDVRYKYTSGNICIKNAVHDPFKPLDFVILKHMYYYLFIYSTTTAQPPQIDSVLKRVQKKTLNRWSLNFR